MSANEEAVEAGSDSFWEIGQYKRTVRRCDDGFELCSKLMQLIQERSEIERSYASSLHRWSQKWHNFLEKGPEYGTMKSAWNGFTEEADALSEIHFGIATNLINDVQAQVKAWQKENYHKSSLPPQRLKNSKEFEDKFQRAQKQWGRQYRTVQEAKKAYHAACKQERSLKLQLQNAKNDPSAQADQVRKLEDKTKKADRDVERTESVYKGAVTDMDGMNPGYMRSMSEVFAECQEFEQKRLIFFKDMLNQLHGALDLSKEERLPVTYDNLHNTIQRADAHQDLRWWSQHNGEDMPMQWPKFEEFVPEMKATINKAKKSGSSLATDEGVRLRAINSSHGGSVRGSTMPPEEPHPPQHHEPVNSGGASAAPAPRSKRRSQLDHSSKPFEEPHDAGDEDPLHDDGRPGVTVRALYDYQQGDDDELSFKQGDEFEKLDDEDEQGWCKGRKDGKVGLYPASYVELAH